jgi:hypothetical protein
MFSIRRIFTVFFKEQINLKLFVFLLILAHIGSGEGLPVTRGRAEESSGQISYFFFNQQTFSSSCHFHAILIHIRSDLHHFDESGSGTMQIRHFPLKKKPVQFLQNLFLKAGQFSSMKIADIFNFKGLKMLTKSCSSPIVTLKSWE